jgi:hypothetical protein
MAGVDLELPEVRARPPAEPLPEPAAPLVKPGVNWSDMSATVNRMWPRIEEVSLTTTGRRPVVTSARMEQGEEFGTETQIHKEGSLHYQGEAFDLRTRGLKDDQIKKYRDALAKELGDTWDVLIEDDHIHVEHEGPTRMVQAEEPREPSTQERAETRRPARLRAREYHRTKPTRSAQIPEEVQERRRAYGEMVAAGFIPGKLGEEYEQHVLDNAPRGLDPTALAAAATAGRLARFPAEVLAFGPLASRMTTLAQGAQGMLLQRLMQRFPALLEAPYILPRTAGALRQILPGAAGATGFGIGVEGIEAAGDIAAGESPLETMWTRMRHLPGYALFGGGLGALFGGVAADMAARRMPKHRRSKAVGAPGIRHDPEVAEAYTILGLPENATEAQIKTAYRAAAKRNHPDAGGTHSRFVAVGEAYETIMATRAGKAPPRKPPGEPEPRPAQPAPEPQEPGWVERNRARDQERATRAGQEPGWVERNRARDQERATRQKAEELEHETNFIIQQEAEAVEKVMNREGPDLSPWELERQVEIELQLMKEMEPTFAEEKPEVTPTRLRNAERAVEKWKKRFEQETGFLAPVLEPPIQATETGEERLERLGEEWLNRQIKLNELEADSWKRLTGIMAKLPPEQSNAILEEFKDPERFGRKDASALAWILRGEGIIDKRWNMVSEGWAPDAYAVRSQREHKRFMERWAPKPRERGLQIAPPKWEKPPMTVMPGHEHRAPRPKRPGTKDYSKATDRALFKEYRKNLRSANRIAGNMLTGNAQNAAEHDLNNQKIRTAIERELKKRGLEADLENINPWEGVTRSDFAFRNTLELWESLKENPQPEEWFQREIVETQWDLELQANPKDSPLLWEKLDFLQGWGELQDYDVSAETVAAVREQMIQEEAGEVGMWEAGAPDLSAVPDEELFAMAKGTEGWMEAMDEISRREEAGHYSQDFYEVSADELEARFNARSRFQDQNPDRYKELNDEIGRMIAAWDQKKSLARKNQQEIFAEPEPEVTPVEVGTKRQGVKPADSQAFLVAQAELKDAVALIHGEDPAEVDYVVEEMVNLLSGADVTPELVLEEWASKYDTLPIQQALKKLDAIIKPREELPAAAPEPKKLTPPSDKPAERTLKEIRAELRDIAPEPPKKDVEVKPPETMTDLWGEERPVGPEQPALFQEKETGALTESEEHAKALISSLQGKVRRGDASPEEVLMYGQALQLLRRNEAISEEELKVLAPGEPARDEMVGELGLRIGTPTKEDYLTAEEVTGLYQEQFGTEPPEDMTMWPPLRRPVEEMGIENIPNPEAIEVELGGIARAYYDNVRALEAGTSASGRRLTPKQRKHLESERDRAAFRLDEIVAEAAELYGPAFADLLDEQIEGYQSPGPKPDPEALEKELEDKGIFPEGSSGYTMDRIPEGAILDAPRVPDETIEVDTRFPSLDENLDMDPPFESLPADLPDGSTLYPVNPMELIRAIHEVVGEWKFKTTKRKDVWGFFRSGGEGEVHLNVLLGQNYDQFRRTLAHEVGHWIDYLPDLTLARGNIFGRLGTLRGYLKSTLDQVPTDPSRVITSEERDELRKVAQKWAGPKPDKKKKPQEYENWKVAYQTYYTERIQELMEQRNLLDKERIMEEVRGVSFWWRPWDGETGSEGYKAYRNSSKEIYADLMSVFLNSPGSLRERAPTWFNAFLAYMERKPEVKRAYEDVQALLGRDDAAEAIYGARVESFEKGVEQWEAKLKEHMAAKPRQQPRIERVVQNFLKRAAPSVWAEKRRVGKDLPIGSEEYTFRLTEEEFRKRDNPNYIMMQDMSRDFLIPLEEKGYTLRQADRYAAWKRVAYGDRGGFQHEAQQAIMDITGEDTWEKAERAYHALAEGETYEMEDGTVITEIDPLSDAPRFDPDLWEQAHSGVLNPEGLSPEEARWMLDQMKKQEIGEEKWDEFTKLVDRAYKPIIQRSVLEAVETGVISKAVAEKKILPNLDYYVAFSVADYFNGVVPAKLLPQTGTTRRIGSPITATFFKSMNLQRVVEYQKMKVALVEQALQDWPEHVGEEFILNRRHPNPKFRAENKAPRGKKNLFYYVDGQLRYRALDESVVDQIMEADLGRITRMAQTLGSNTYNILHPLYVAWNLSWKLRNPIRDIQRTYKYLANVHHGKPWYSQVLEAFLDLGRLPAAYRKTREAAKKGAAREYDELIRAMMNDRALAARPFHSWEPQVESESIIQMMQKAGFLDVEATTGKAKVAKIFRALEFGGPMQEIWAKAAAYKLLGDMGITGRRRAMFVRNFSGTPDSTQRGLVSEAVNAGWLYSNVMFADWQAAFESATYPKSRFGWWFRTFLLAAPKLAMIAAVRGAYGKGLEEWFEYVPDYDKEKYIIVPIPPMWVKTASGKKKAVYLRLPHDDLTRIPAAIAWALVGAQKPLSTQRISEIATGEFPGPNPLIDMSYKWYQFETGKNPHDNWLGRQIIPRIEEQAGGWPARKEMLRWTAGEFGLLSEMAGYWTYAQPKEERAPFERLVRAIPGISGIIKISDRGLNEAKWTQQAIEDQRDARLKTDLSDSVRKATSTRNILNRLGDEKLDADEQRERRQLNVWYNRYYDPITDRMEAARDAGDKDLYKQLADDLHETTKRISLLPLTTRLPPGAPRPPTPPRPPGR